MENLNIIGLMSGTSLDGLDIAHCTFTLEKEGWKYTLTHGETIAYSSEWRSRLSSVERGAALDLALTDVEFGHLMGTLTREFIQKHQLQPDFIASHGHTIFHQPHRKLTTQIGKGSAIAAETALPVVSDFRSLDVALGGQGAPLVPIGDQLLFHQFDYCLNLGGFANISYQQHQNRIAFDICPVNIVLNYLASKIGKSYDHDGEMASIGSVSSHLLNQLNHLPYFQQQPPKSLGKEWVVSHVLPILDSSTLRLNDLLATFCEHIAMQIASSLDQNGSKKVLITGGGALNSFLISRIKQHTQVNLEIPDSLTINFKEALIFAFLGLLRWRNEVNCLKSVTGAATNSIGGSIYLHR